MQHLWLMHPDLWRFDRRRFIAGYDSADGAQEVIAIIRTGSVLFVVQQAAGHSGHAENRKVEEKRIELSKSLMGFNFHRHTAFI